VVQCERETEERGGLNKKEKGRERTCSPFLPCTALQFFQQADLEVYGDTADRDISKMLNIEAERAGEGERLTKQINLPEERPLFLSPENLLLLLRESENVGFVVDFHLRVDEEGGREP